MEPGEHKICPICEEGTLNTREERNEVEFRGVTSTVPFFYQQCDSCGSEQADVALARRNRRIVLEWRAALGDQEHPGGGPR